MTDFARATDFEAKAQQAAEADLDDLPEPAEQPCGPFCGCDTCIVREVLDAAWPYLLELAREEVRRPLAVVE
jgi:hypothetical protein